MQYKDAAGNYHAVFHLLYNRRPSDLPCGQGNFLGGHAFSPAGDGLTWTFTGVAFDGNYSYIGEEAAGIQHPHYSNLDLEEALYSHIGEEAAGIQHPHSSNLDLEEALYSHIGEETAGIKHPHSRLLI